MSGNSQTTGSTKMWSVCVIDMFSYQEPDGDFEITGFADEATATEYARRRTRDSLESLRKEATSDEDLRQRWFSFGEDCLVMGGSYKGLSELAHFIKHPATESEHNWAALTPSREVQS